MADSHKLIAQACILHARFAEERLHIAKENALLHRALEYRGYCIMG
jgi:hypothetical protein